MFGASSNLAPTVQLRRSSAPVVEPRVAATSAAASGASGSFAGRASVLSAVAVAAGASAVIGGRLLYATAASPSSPSSSWLSRLVQRLPLLGRQAAAADDEDDDFASGTGAANLFDAEKSRARQELLRGKAKGSTAAGRPTGGAAGATAASSPAAPKGYATSSEPVWKAVATAAATGLDGSKDMADREQHIKLIRALLQREAGIAYDDEDASSTSSDSTDVSLNYHLATAMEANARDELLMAFADFEEANGGDVYGSAAPAASNDEAAELHANIMVRTLEYLDMSNEREKLRQRRVAVHRADGRPTPVSSVDADGDREGDEDEGDDDMMVALYRRFATEYAGRPHGGGDEDDDGEEDDGFDDYPSAMERQAQRFQSMMLGSIMSRPSAAGAESGALDDDDSVLNRILGQRSAGMPMMPSMMPTPSGTAARRRIDEDGDMMEDGWAEAEDDAEEAEFMAYLQQQDNAPHFYSRAGMRQARRDPGNDVRVVGMDDNLFGGADETEWEDEDDEDDEDGADGDEDDEEDGAAIPWSRRDKADFERELFARIHQLAARTELTVDMAEREVEAEEARKEKARTQRRQQKAAQAAPPPPASAAAEARESGTRATAAAEEGGEPDAGADEEDEWEDEADWEDA